jgi:plastocyanin
MPRIVLVLSVVACLSGAAIASASPVRPQVIHLSAPVSGLRYDQKVVRAHVGRLEIVFLNRSALRHNVNVELGEHEFGKSATVSHGTTKFFVTLKRGTYNFYCSVPGHEDAGMHGTLIVS